jgi:hypothetical protein
MAVSARITKPTSQLWQPARGNGTTDHGKIDTFVDLSRDASKLGWWHNEARAVKSARRVPGFGSAPFTSRSSMSAPP